MAAVTELRAMLFDGYGRTPTTAGGQKVRVSNPMHLHKAIKFLLKAEQENQEQKCEATGDSPVLPVEELVSRSVLGNTVYPGVKYGFLLKIITIPDEAMDEPRNHRKTEGRKLNG